MKKTLILTLIVMLAMPLIAQAGTLSGQDSLEYKAKSTLVLFRSGNNGLLDEINAAYEISDAKVDDDYYPQTVMVEVKLNVWPKIKSFFGK